MAVELPRPYFVAVELDDDDLPDQVVVDPQVDGESFEHLAEVVIELEEQARLWGFHQVGDCSLVDVDVLVLLVFFGVGFFSQSDDSVAEVGADVFLLPVFHVLDEHLFDLLFVEFRG